MITLGGRPCIDPKTLAEECAALGIPLGAWHGKVNSYRCPVGRGPGRGYVLLTRADYNAIDWGAYQSLAFDDGDGNSAAIQKLTGLNPNIVTPGHASDTAAAVLVEVADRRHHLDKTVVDKGYNVRKPDGTGYQTQTLNSGAAWTWQQIVTDLVTACGLTTLTLPFTPDATPENFDFYGASAWESLHVVLDRIVCTTRYDPVADTFAIIRMGVADAAADAVETALARHLVWDAGNLYPARSWRPEKARVLFRRRPVPTDGTSPFWAEDVTLAAAAGVLAGTYVTIHDDLSALGATGTPTNSAAITTRAAERAGDWLRHGQTFASPRLKTWVGVRNVRAVIGSKSFEWSIEDRGNGMFTSLAAKPAIRDRDFNPFIDFYESAGDGSFWAEITGGPSTGAYSWKQIVLSAGVYVDASPSVTGSLNAYPTYVGGLAPFAQAGTQVRMWPSPTQSGKYEFEPMETPFWAEITGGPSSGAYSWKMRTLTAGVWGDVAGFTGTYNAYPVQLDGSTPAVETGTTVWMWRGTSGQFAFQIFQPATYDEPGLVTTTTQVFRGDKTFRCDSLAVRGDLSDDVAFTVGSLGALVVGQVGTDMTVDLLGGNSDSGNGIVSVGGGVSASTYTVRYDLTHGASFYISTNGLGNLYVAIGGTFGSAFDAFQFDPTTGIFQVGGTSLRVSTDVRVGASGSYWVGTDQGITANKSFVDINDNTHDVTIDGGIITDWTITMPPPPASPVAEILADGGVDGGTF